nr:protein spa1-related 3 [Quercus suber]
MPYYGLPQFKQLENFLIVVVDICQYVCQAKVLILMRSSCWIVMEGSSESAWQESDSSRGLNSSSVSDRNRRVLSANRIGLSGDTSNDSVFRKERSRVVLAHTDHHLKNQGGLSGVCEDEVAVDPFVRAIKWGDVSLRQWLDKPERTVDGFECLHIFRQIVEIILLMETNWYTSPEEVAGSPSSCASDIYRLGVLLFELFCPFSSREEKSRTMSSLRHRVLPPQLLLKWPKEASFCLWLLHPDASGRPKMGELLQSEFLNEPRDDLEEREAAIELRERIEEQELLLEFLLLIQQRKQEAADKLQDTISFLCADIEEVMKQQALLKKKGGSCPEMGKDDLLMSSLPPMNIVDSGDSTSLGSRKRFRPGMQIQNIEEYDDNLDDGQKSDTLNENIGSLLSKSSRLMKNFKKLEAAYFLTRCRPVKPSGKPLIRHSTISSDGKGSIVLTERSSVNNLASKEQYSEGRQTGWINPFLEAGVNKKIKVFECDTIINEDRDIHYPVVEMASRSKLSSICWNSYIKSQIASSNFEGVVQVWDVTRSQALMEMREHERRVWSIDYSSADPTMLASGSDDSSVKLWSINQGVSIGTIKTKANVCCVQFPLDSSRSLAFGSADHKIYYYDLRNLKIPLCTFIGHNKTVSYIKFVDATSIVSASTDNTLKLWDLSMCTPRVNDTPVQSFTGHMNVKNFVGLSVSDGYIATGSETNEVFIYHKAFPMPALSFKYHNTDPLSGHEMDDAAQFISSVCWRGQSSTLVAANSTGNIKILEMV